MNIAEQIYALFHPRIRFVILSIIIAEIDKFFSSENKYLSQSFMRYRWDTILSEMI